MEDAAQTGDFLVIFTENWCRCALAGRKHGKSRGTRQIYGNLIRKMMEDDNQPMDFGAYPILAQIDIVDGIFVNGDIIGTACHIWLH